MTPRLAAERRKVETMRAILSFSHIPTYDEIAEKLRLRSRSAAMDRVRSISRTVHFSPEISERLKGCAEQLGKPFDLVLCLAQHEAAAFDLRETSTTKLPDNEPERQMFGHPF